MTVSFSRFITVGTIKCYFCGRIGGVLTSVHDYGSYGEVGLRIHYHRECLELVELYPTAFPSIMVDKVLHIEELKKDQLVDFNSKIIEKYEEKIEKAKQKHFENMMPSK